MWDCILEHNVKLMGNNCTELSSNHIVDEPNLNITNILNITILVVHNAKFIHKNNDDKFSMKFIFPSQNSSTALTYGIIQVSIHNTQFSQQVMITSYNTYCVTGLFVEIISSFRWSSSPSNICWNWKLKHFWAFNET